MSAFTLSAPKKKKRIQCPRHPPFPIPVENSSRTLNQRWRVFTGVLQGSVVLVRHSGDMHHLYNMGFFGTGCLRIPSHEPDQQNEPMTIKAKRKYLRHLASARMGKDLLPSAQAVPFIHTLMASSARQEIVDENDESYSGSDTDGVELGDPSTTCTSADTTDCVQPGVQAWSDRNTCLVNETLKMDDVIGIPPRPERHDAWESNTAKESEDFWGTPSVSETQETDRLGTGWVGDSETADWGTQGERVDSKASEFWGSNTSKLNEDSKPPDVRPELNVVDKQEAGAVSQSNAIRSSADIHNTLTGNCGHVETTEPCGIPTTAVKQDCVMSGNVSMAVDKERGCPGDEGNTARQRGEKRKYAREWSSDTKRFHFLQLSLEEAFFLAYGLGCLLVKDNDQVMSLSAMWQRFSTMKAQFVPHYIAYHHMRSKGWVPKQGLKFGADFLLYKEGPPFYHATYSMVVQTVNQTTVAPVKGYNSREFSWTTLAALNRITEQVKKDVLFVYVLLPDTGLDTPACLHHSAVSEVVLRRWISKYDRENIQSHQIP